ncbi:hypothetical protein CEXT_539001 [Caerostris extrusa]|uniref:Uncharacterized protein n=1 Tax=Caerostris extrusa TaxID=172846 RepID=A0AAV4XZT8_CAEEX|nr:hypothetical protein CEXT_539001 [Caerostris extrusa]
MEDWISVAGNNKTIPYLYSSVLVTGRSYQLCLISVRFVQLVKDHVRVLVKVEMLMLFRADVFCDQMLSRVLYRRSRIQFYVRQNLPQTRCK